MSSVVNEVRHSLLQTEQNTMAEMQDETLRQQTGILMSNIKEAVALMDVSVSHQVWVAQKAEEKGKHTVNLFALLAAIILIIVTVIAYLQNLWFLFGANIAMMILGIIAVITQRKNGGSAIPQDKVNVTITPDTDKLLKCLDRQMNAADRYLKDFSTLNDQLRGGEGASSTLITRAAEMAEALFECDEANRQPAEEAAANLLSAMGLTMLRYSGENSGYFNILPSKKHTRTLSPAILSSRDHKLLRRGSAAVCEKTADESAGDK